MWKLQSLQSYDINCCFLIPPLYHGNTTLVLKNLARRFLGRICYNDYYSEFLKSFLIYPLPRFVLPHFSLRKGAAAQTCSVCLWLVDSWEEDQQTQACSRRGDSPKNIFPTSKHFHAPPLLKILLKNQTLSDWSRTLTASGLFYSMWV